MRKQLSILTIIIFSITIQHVSAGPCCSKNSKADDPPSYNTFRNSGLFFQAENKSISAAEVKQILTALIAVHSDNEEEHLEALYEWRRSERDTMPDRIRELLAYHTVLVRDFDGTLNQNFQIIVGYAIRRIQRHTDGPEESYLYVLNDYKQLALMDNINKVSLR